MELETPIKRALYVIVTIVLILEGLTFLNINRYQEQIYIPILFLICGVGIFVNAFRSEMFEKTGKYMFSSQLWLIVGLLLMFITPSIFNFYIYSKYNKRINYLLEHNNEVHKLHTLGNVIMIIQTIMFLFIMKVLIKGTNADQLLNVGIYSFIYFVIAIINGILTGAKLTQVVHYSTDGFRSR